MPQNASEVRFAAQSLYQNAPNTFRPAYGPPMPRSLSQTASFNLYTEEFLSGLSDGQMSVVRRFFILFVTFDLVFISLLWLICLVINGADIYDALRQQILEYEVHRSLFDVVGAAIFRFSLLILFYAILSVNHWFVVALSTAVSCIFLTYKVIVFSWVDTKEPVFQVLLVVVSFMLAWSETWFLDCRVIPTERHARTYQAHIQSQFRDDARAPLVAPFLDEQQEAANSTFYSPYETIHNSDDENDAQDEEWRQMGEECVQRAARLLEAGDWQVDRVTEMGDTIQSVTLPKLGKVWRVTAKLNFPAKLLLEHLFYKVEDFHTWNTTILESRILYTINRHCDITYQLTAGAGMVKSRDFVNLRCWHLCRDGRIVRDSTAANDSRPPSFTMPSSLTSEICTHNPSASSSATASTTTTTAHPPVSASRRLIDFTTVVSLEDDGRQSASAPIGTTHSDESTVHRSGTGLGKSLGASGFFDADDVASDDGDLEYADAEDDQLAAGTPTAKRRDSATATGRTYSARNLYVSSAISIEYGKLAAMPKYIRGENRLSCWAMREIDGKAGECIFEWLMCIDLKGYVPTQILNKVYPKIIQDYMVALRKYCEDAKNAHRMQQQQIRHHQQS